MHVWLSSCFGSRTEVQANSAYACPSFRRTASDVFIQVRMIWLEGGNPRPTSKPTQSHGSRAPEHTGGNPRPTSGPAQRVGIVPTTDVPIGRRRMCSLLRIATQQSETEQRRNGGIVFYCLYRSEIKVQLNTNKTLYSGMLLTILSSLTTSS